MNKNTFPILLGCSFEFYDFMLYFYMSNVISEKFYSKLDSYHIITYLLLITFISRIIGSIIYSNFADLNKKQSVLKNTTMIMGISSVLLIFIPTYSKIGVFSFLFLLLIRFIQGISVGGQIPVSISYLMDISTNKIKMSGIIFCFFAIGNSIASVAYLLVKRLTPHQFFTVYGWKIPFIVGGILVLISFKIKQKNTEYIKSNEKTIKIPFFHCLKYYKINTIFPIIMYSFSGLIMFTFFIFLPSKIISKIPELKSYMQLIVFISLILVSITCYYSTNIFKNIFIKNLSFFMTFVFLIAVFLLDTNFYKNIIFLILIYFLMSIFSSIVFSSIYIISYKSFPKKISCSGIGIVSSISTCFSSLISHYIMK